MPIQVKQVKPAEQDLNHGINLAFKEGEMTIEQVLLEQLEGFELDMKWLSQHYDKLKERYPDQYVAVLAYRVVDHDDDLKSLVARLDQKYQADSGRIAIKYVTPKKVELIL